MKEPSFNSFIHLFIYSFIALVAISIIGFQFLYNLDLIPIQVWDESRQAQNCISMIDRGEYLITYFDNSPDYWNTKPPLLIWIQTLLSKLIGFGYYSLRLPSALAAIFTAIMISTFLYFKTKSIFGAFITGLLLSGICSYNGIHCARTGDYDALLTLFTTATICSSYMYYSSKRIVWIYLTGLSMTLAVLTKGVAGLLFLPSVIILLALSWRQIKLHTTHLIIAIMLSVVGMITYYFLRGLADPNYLSAVWQNELGGRFGEAIEQHSGPITFYLNHLWENETLLVALLAIGSATLLNIKPKRNLFLIGYLFLVSIQFLTVISIAQTKLPWYLCPIYPIIALIIGACVSNIESSLKNNSKIIFTSLITLIVLQLNYSCFSTNQNYTLPEYAKKDYELSQFIKSRREQNIPIEECIYFNSYHPQIWVEIYISIQDEFDICFKEPANIKSNEKIILFQEDVINNHIDTTFSHEKKNGTLRFYVKK